MPSHNHKGIDIDGVYVFGWDSGNVAGTNWMKNMGYNDKTTNRVETGYTGGGQSFSIMPPYMNVYMWRRTA